MTQITKEHIFIQLYFSDALLISIGGLFDNLNVTALSPM